MADPDPYDRYSMIRPIGYSSSGSCGYCHGEPRNGITTNRYSYYATTKAMDPFFYQALLDRCWRRSGTLLYRPNQRDSCCPHYTIRLDVDAFRPSKDQRQTINRWNRFVLGEAYMAAAARARPRSRAEAKQRDSVFDLVVRVHEAEAAVPVGSVPPAHTFTVDLDMDAFSEEKYLVFENYQRLVHKEPPEKISRDGFRSFLCGSPLRRSQPVWRDDGSDGLSDKSWPQALGSVHMVYRLDGRIVAVGVLDLLPQCVSAVYFFYHESIHAFSPGKLGALHEIALARETGCRWWYSGFYIHSCAKMRYKIDFAPQAVLDPATPGAWHALDAAALARLDAEPYVTWAEGDDRPPLDIRDPDPSWLLASSMPGLPPLRALEAYDFGALPVALRGPADVLYAVTQLPVWSGSVADGDSLKGKLAELVAMIGVDLMKEVCLDFR